MGSRLVSQAGYVAGFTLYSETKEKPLEGGKQGRDMLFCKITLISV